MPPFDQVNPYSIFGMTTVTRNDGAGLPSGVGSSYDHASQVFHPDSGAFWLAGVIVLTALGIAGASVKLHAGPARVGASLGKD
jgi:hypothetical protein